MTAEQPLPYTTREAWLLALVDTLRPHFAALDYELPDKLRISCGWPSTRALATKRRRVGECWAYDADEGGYVNIFVSPFLAKDMEVAEVVVHELGHAHLGAGVGHKGPFRAFCKTLGLAGKPTATYASPELIQFLEKKLVALGPYPSSRLDKTAGPQKKQTTRMAKISCDGKGEHETYILRGAKATLAKGVPECPLCGEDMVLEQAPEEEDES